MRQFEYKYTSRMINKHGFFTFLPHAKIFNPFFGFKYFGGVLKARDDYTTEWISAWARKYRTATFRQKIKMFFPEIKSGLLYVDKVNYQVISDPIDEIEIKHRIITNSKYYDYVEIKHHIVEFDVEYIVDREYFGLNKPFEIMCNSIELMLFNQRISISITENSIKCVPYFTAHRADNAVNTLIPTNVGTTENTNKQLKYTFILDKEGKDFLDKYNIETTEVVPVSGVQSYLENDSRYYLYDELAYACKYALEEDYLAEIPEDDEFMLLLSNEFFMNSCDMFLYQSPWNFGSKALYKTAYRCYNLPGELCKCDPDNVIIPQEVVRGNVIKSMLDYMSYSHEELIAKIDTLPPLAIKWAANTKSLFRKNYKSVYNPPIVESEIIKLMN